jgi:hypothetical protein
MIYMPLLSVNRKKNTYAAGTYAAGEICMYVVDKSEDGDGRSMSYKT